MALYYCSKKVVLAIYALMLGLMVSSCSQKKFSFRSTIKVEKQELKSVPQENTRTMYIEANSIVPIIARPIDNNHIHPRARTLVPKRAVVTQTHTLSQLSKGQITQLFTHMQSEDKQLKKTDSKFWDVVARAYLITATLLASTIFLLARPDFMSEEFQKVVLTLFLIGVAMLAIVILPILLIAYLKK
jgi:hypothetical protein